MNDIDDILDLCRLNLMEPNVSASPAVDRDTTLEAIDWSRRQIVTRLTNRPATLAPGAMERHVEQNTARDGVYPWTESPAHGLRIIEEEALT